MELFKFMKKEDIKNWKLLEVLSEIIIVKDDSSDYFDFLVDELDIPMANHSTINREFTNINWLKMSPYFKFYLDDDTHENNEIAFNKSKLSKKENLLILYGSKQPAILIPTKLFIRDWEDFIASTQWETIIFSEDFELVMEVSRDYYLHSNFKIK